MQCMYKTQYNGIALTLVGVEAVKTMPAHVYRSEILESVEKLSRRLVFQP